MQVITTLWIAQKNWRNILQYLNIVIQLGKPLNEWNSDIHSEEAEGGFSLMNTMVWEWEIV